MDVIKLAKEKGYSIDLNGNIRNKLGERIEGCKKQSGYIQISMTYEKRKYYCLAHRLQAYQKYGEAMFEPGLVVRHKDGNPANNSFENIRIGTQQENMMDIPKGIRIKKAIHAASFNAKHDKNKIREFHQRERSYRKTMQRFNISSKGTLSYILTS